MSGTAAELVCKTTVGGTWVVCPVCRRGKLLKLTEATRAQGLVLFCRCCKHETVVEIGPGGGGLPRVWAAAAVVTFTGRGAVATDAPRREHPPASSGKSR